MVLQEDSSYFWSDIYEVTCSTGTTINNGVKGLLDSIALSCTKTSEMVATGGFKISHLGQSIVAGIGWTLIQFKAMLLLLGDGAWFLVTLVPNFLFWLAELLLIGVAEVCTSLCRIVELLFVWTIAAVFISWQYFVDVPLHCLLGLLAIYVCFKARFALYRRLRWTVQQLVDIFQRYTDFLRLRHMRRRRLNFEDFPQEVPLFSSSFPAVGGHTSPQPRKSIRLAAKSSPESACCVVCLDRKKTVLVMPCKHLCLCRVCSIELERYQSGCPLCRNEISSLIAVYT